MSKKSFWLLLALTPTLILGVLPRTYADGTLPAQTRTWKPVDELSPQELREVDLSTNTPRHGQVPYLPAESYPFTVPYTAEEMGYRMMEFTQRPRWSSVFANVWGSISPQGVLLSPGKSVTFMTYAAPAGVAAEFARKPGEEMYRYLNQNP